MQRELTSQLARDAQLVTDMQDDMAQLQRRLAAREAECSTMHTQLQAMHACKADLETRLEHLGAAPWQSNTKDGVLEGCSVVAHVRMVTGGACTCKDPWKPLDQQ